MSNRPLITIDISTQEIDRVLGVLMQKLANPRPLLLEIGEEVVDSTHKRFETSTDPEGNPWQENSDVTLERKSGNKPLIDTHTLFGSIHYQLLGGDTVVIGTNMEYAAMMQFGGSKDDFPHLWGDIPARPYLGISDADEQTILALTKDYLL